MNLPTSLMRWAVSAALLAAAGHAHARANDFPTTDRVLYVQECMRNHPGPNFEMVNKCGCALDKLAEEVSFDDYLTMATATNANSIGGERGNSIRDVAMLQDQIKRFRGLQSKVGKACFLTP